MRTQHIFLFLNKLAVIKLGIKSVLFKKLCVSSLLDNVSVLHNEYQVGFLNGRKSVGNDKARAPVHHRRKCLLNTNFGSRIY